MFPCSGGADVGALSDAVARKLSKDGKAKMFCLAGIGAHVDGMIESAKSADKIISIDGCPAMCARRLLEHAGFVPEPYVLKQFGFEKGKSEINDNVISDVTSRIIGGSD
ncbi:MAG: putative zinc-binding protein [Candidatus Kaelpia imicola]|nr:putative zinc-binding protein [Candidatus Kaelpia imicola]